jgi:hypothetical protein
VAGVLSAVKSPKNFAILFLALAVLSVATVAWNQHQELIALRASAIDQDDRAALRKKIWDAEARAKELEAQLAALRNRGTGEGGDEVETAASDGSAQDGQNRRGRRGPGGGGGGPGGIVNNVMNMMEQPEMQRLMAIQQKGQLDSRYAALFKNLKLSPEQLDKFKTLLVEKQTALQDVLAAARSQGISLRDDPEGFRKMVADTQAEVDNSIRATLGDEGFAKYQNYQETIPQRSVVNQLQQSLSYTGSPLSDTQAEQLIQILAQTTPKNSGGNRSNLVATETASVGFTAAIPGSGRGGGGGGGDRMVFSLGGGLAGAIGGASTPITDEAITLAQGVLSPSQVEGLQQLQQQQQAQQQLQQAIRQNTGGGNGGRNSGGTTGSSGNTTTTTPTKKG